MLTGPRGIDASPYKVREDIHSVRAYIERHFDDLEAYVRDNYAPESFEPHLRDLLREPYTARTIIENYNTSNASKWERLINFLASRPSYQVCVIGRKRHRKTMTTWDILEAVHKRTGRPVFAIGAHGPIPEFATAVTSLEEVKRWGLAIWDETAIDGNARTSMTSEQRTIPADLAVIGHRNIQLYTVIQNTKLGDLTFVTLADAYLMKPVNLAQMSTERGSISRLLTQWRELVPQEPWESLFLSPDMHPLRFTREVPAWWKPEFSQAFDQMPEEVAVAYAAKLALRAGGGMPWKAVARNMQSRGWRRSPQWWKQRVLESRGLLEPASEVPPPQARG